jgi:hypothetical protein
VTTGSAIEAVLPDWTMGANPHLGIIGSQAELVIDILTTTYLRQFPTAVVGDLSERTTSQTRIDLASVNLVTGNFEPEAFYVFDRFFRSYGIDPQPILDQIRRGKPGTTDRKRMTLRADRNPEFATESIGHRIWTLHDYHLMRLYREPVFTLPDRSVVNHIELANNPDLAFQDWTVDVTVAGEDDLRIYRAEGYLPMVTPEIMAKEAKFLAEALWETGKYVDRAAVDDLAGMQVDEEIWRIACDYSPIQESQPPALPLAALVSAVQAAGAQDPTNPLGRLLESLSGPHVLPSVYDEPGITLVNTANVHHLKLGFFLAGAFAATAAPKRGDRPKYTIIRMDDLVRFDDRTLAGVLEGVEMLVRQGRKHASHLVVIARDLQILTREPIARLWGFIGNRMIDARLANDPFSPLSQASSAPLGEQGVYHWMDTTLSEPIRINPGRVLASAKHHRVEIPWSLPYSNT